MIAVPEPSEFALTAIDETTEVWRYAIGPRELENQASDTHAEMQRVRTRIHAEVNFKSKPAEMIGAVGDRVVDPLFSHWSRGGNEDGYPGSINIDDEIAEV
jgi:predicted phosphoribosyltransferase